MWNVVAVRTTGGERKTVVSCRLRLRALVEQRRRTRCAVEVDAVPLYRYEVEKA